MGKFVIIVSVLFLAVFTEADRPHVVELPEDSPDRMVDCNVGSSIGISQGEMKHLIRIIHSTHFETDPNLELP